MLARCRLVEGATFLEPHKTLGGVKQCTLRQKHPPQSDAQHRDAMASQLGRLVELVNRLQVRAVCGH